MNASCQRIRPLLLAVALAASVLLHGCNTEAAPLWQLVDPGGGGAAPAVYRIPGSEHLFVGSDVGGFRYSDDAGKQFRVINEGLDFASSASDNIQKITSYRRGDTHHVVGSATAGVLYWRSVGNSGLGPAWIKFFDARQSKRGGATTLAALAVDSGARHLYAGVGNQNNLALNRLTKLDPQQSGRIYIFGIGEDQAKPVPPQPAGFLSLESVCTGLEGGPYFHVSDLAAVSVDGEEYLYVGTSEGLLIIRGPRSDAVDCQRRSVAGRNTHVLAVRPDPRNPADVVLLLNEGPLTRQNDKSGKSSRSYRKGGVFHTRSVLAPSPAWRNITPAKAQGKGLGELERGRINPAELVLSGDARSPLGLLYTPDFSRGSWRVVLDRSFISRKGKTRDLDGWRRSENSFRGVKGLAIEEDADGIATLYVAGFQGRLLVGHRDAGGFNFEQAYTIVEERKPRVRYGNRGVPLMNPWRVFVDPRDGERVIFLYFDNLLFVSDDAGSSFRRPIVKLGWGTDVTFDPNAERLFLAYSIGNHLESGRRNKAERGGIMLMSRQATAWKEFKPRLPAAGPVEALTMSRGELCANVYRKGVFCTAIDGNVYQAWRRAVPKKLDVLHLIDVDDEQALWVVAAAGKARQICRIAAGEPTCSVLPVTKRDFERLWFDGGRLWLSTKRGTSYSSKLQPSLEWEAIDAAITDMRTLSIEEEQVVLIASGTDGLFATRTPLLRDSWCQISFDGLDGNRVVSAIADPAGADYLYVAVPGVGFYRASLKNLAADVVANCPGEI